MKKKLITRAAFLCAIVLSSLTLSNPPAVAQSVTDELEVMRGILKADRKVMVAEVMQFTEAESTAFWPLYRDYRIEMDRLGDSIVKLVLEYADTYPAVAEDRAAAMLKDYLALEKNWDSVRAKHLKKMSKVLPASKVLRFAQVENRLDLALRLQMAGAVPLVPAGQPTR
jgi:hypothetical protein